MHNPNRPREAGGEAVALQAFLYANRELDGDEAAAFEHRLGEDHSAREALCQAAELMLALSPQRPALPDPSYRERVRQRLRRQNCWSWLVSRRTYRGHPALWCAVGAAAAVVLVMALAHFPSTVVAQPHPPLPEPRQPDEQVIPAPIVEPPELAATENIATIFTTIDSTTRVIKAHDEEMLRKQRFEERGRLGKPADRRPRLPAEQAPGN